MLTENKISQLLWLLVASSMFLFSTSYFRFNFGPLHLPVPVVLVGFVVYCCLVYLFMHGGRFNMARDYRIFVILYLAFLLWHLGSSVFAVEYQQRAWGEIVKLITGGFIAGIVVTGFPRNEKFLETFWRFVLWASVPFFAYLLYRSVLARNFFLVVDLKDVTQQGAKNQIATCIALILPYALYHFLLARKKWFTFIPLVVLVISLIYTLSRSNWAAGLFSFLLLPVFLWRRARLKSIKLFTVAMLIGTTLVGSTVLMISKLGVSYALMTRASWILNPDSVPQLHSYEARGERIGWALEGFRKVPLFGCGLGNSTCHNGGDVHNDHAHILAELGLIGEFLFLGILGFVAFKIFRKDKNLYPESWVFLATRASFVNLIFLMNFNTTYTSPYNWIFLGLFLVSAELEKNCFERSVRNENSACV